MPDPVTESAAASSQIITCPKPSCDVEIGTDQRDAQLTHHTDGSHTFHPLGRPKNQPAWENEAAE